MSRQWMKGAQFSGKDRLYRRVLLHQGRNPATNRDQSRTMMRNSISSKIKYVRTDRVAQRMQATGQAVDNVFRLILLVANDRVLHSSDVFENEPIRLQLLKNVYARKNQAVALVFLRTVARADGSRDTTRTVGGHSLTRRGQGKKPRPPTIKLGTKIVDVGILQFPDVPLKHLGPWEIAPDKGSTGRNQFTSGKNRDLSSPLDPDIPHSTSGEKGA